MYSIVQYSIISIIPFSSGGVWLGGRREKTAVSVKSSKKKGGARSAAAPDGGWRWRVDGSSIRDGGDRHGTYSHWLPNYDWARDMPGDVDDCLVMEDGADGYWRGDSCRQRRSFVCASDIQNLELEQTQT